MAWQLWIWGTLLFLGIGASAQNISVSVSCGSSHLVITVPVDLFGTGVPVEAEELILGSGCVATSVDLQTLQLDYPLIACGATRRLLPGSIHYRNVLHYVPLATNGVIRASHFSHPIDCFYPRSWNVSSLGLRPTWVPFSSTLMDMQRLDFALEVFDSTWSRPVSDPIYYLGDLINIQASVRRDGQYSSSRFLATQEHNTIRFQLDTFTFIGASNNQVYLICHLKAVSAGSADSLNKACSFDRTTASWNSHEGGDCSCCASGTGCDRKRRKRRQQQRKGLSGEADLEVGPIALKASKGDMSAMEGTSTLELTALTSAATLETPHAAILPPDQGVNTIVMRGETKDQTTTSTSGLHLPFSTATLVIAVACAFMVFVSILGCYCSARRSHRGYRMEVVGAALGEAGAVAMAPAAAGSSGAGASGDSNGPSKKAGVAVAAANGQSAYV
ncbi:hypothetical protein lerEdw1_007402 [Lerista edwardsae]|nr:hypothetical protein lerEdw1_007402 [Lerista edwardsae]